MDCPPAGPEGVDFFGADLKTFAMPQPGPTLSTAMLDAAVELIGKSGRLGSVEVAGTSMLPTFERVERLAVEFSPGRLEYGDVLVFRQRGILVVHRLVQRRRQGPSHGLRTRGDGTIAFDPWLEPGSVIGRVVAVGYADGSWRNLRNFRARLYAHALGLHGLVWGGMGAFVAKYGGSTGESWRWRLGRIDFFKLRVTQAVFFRALHPRIPAPEFVDSRPNGAPADVQARCYTPDLKK